jgi:ankyrin repeat protein
MRPLHGASFYGSVNTACLLIEHGADVLAPDETGSIPFAHACRNSHYDILEMFYRVFDHHEKVDEIVKSIDVDHNTLLHLAVASANVKIVDFLISKKADLSAKREDGQTAIHLCAKTDSVEILEKLIHDGAKIDDVDNENENILHKSAAHNKENVLKYALSESKSKQNPNFIKEKNNAGVTPLLLAAQFGHTACVALLLEAGADMFTDRDKRERGPVYLASMSNHIQTLEILLQHARESSGLEKEKLAVNEIDRYSRTGLHAAAELGHVDIVKELLKRGASLTMKDDDEYTALMLCCKKNRLDVLKVFIEYINGHYPTAREKLNIFEERDDGSNTGNEENDRLCANFF